MKVLNFESYKYGKELLIDATDESQLQYFEDAEVSFSFYAILFVQKGSGIFHLDNEPISLESNQVIFIRPSQIAQTSGFELQKCKMLFFEGAFLDEFFVDKNFIYKFKCFHSLHTDAHLVLEQDVFAKYETICEEIQEEIHHQNADSNHILRSLIYYMLLRLDGLYNHTYHIEWKHAADVKFLEFQRKLFTKIPAIKTVEDFAKELKISRIHLNTICKKHLSKTAKQVINEHLMAEIKKALRYSSKDLAQIAYDFNFSAPSNFSRFIKQMTGLSPQDYRDSLSK